MTNFKYKAYGLNISSEFPIDGFDVSEFISEPDIHIKIGAIDTSGYKIRKGFLIREVTDHGFLYCIKDVASFLVQNGQTIIIDPIATEKHAWQMYLLGSVFGSILQQRGFLTLHGSAVLSDGKAHLILGDSGMGKSSIAMTLNQVGHQLLTDDICAVNFNTQGEPVLYHGNRHVKLWQDAMEVLGIEQEGMPKVREDLPKFRMVVDSGGHHDSHVIGNIFILNIGCPEGFQVQKLDLMETLRFLNLNVYRKNFLQDMKLDKMAFDRLSRLANTVTCTRVTRSYAKMDVRIVSRQIESLFKL